MIISLIKESFNLEEGNLPIILSSIDSGTWYPDFVHKINFDYHIKESHNFVRELQKIIQKKIKQV